MFRGIQKDQKHLVWQDKERLPSSTVCCFVYLVAMSTLAPSIVSLALLYPRRRKRGGYPLLSETSLRQLKGTTRVASKKLRVP